VKLRKQDQEFRNPKVFYPDPKNVDLDRVLINLFLLLKCGGRTHATRGRTQAEFEKVDRHLDTLQKMPDVQGFSEHAFIAKRWLESDIFDLVNRGKPGAEAIASLRPLHLEAHKIRVAKHCRDYNHADALYAMLEYGERQALDDLKEYLDRGRNPATGKYDGKTTLDLETLTVLKLVEGIPDRYASGDKLTPDPPVCIGQSRVLCDDIQRILAYRDVVPRPTMVDYLKTIFGVHLAIYVLRLSRQLSGWIQDKAAHPTCLSCPVDGKEKDPFHDCPYQVRMVADMGDDYRSRMAQLAKESAAAEYDGRLSDLVKAIFAMNQLLRYARWEKLPDDPRKVPALLAAPPEGMEADFKRALKDLATDKNEDEELPPEIEAILSAEISSFDKLIEIVAHVRQKHHLKYLVQMLDKLLQKNSPFGALVQGRSASNPRRFHLGGRLLEVLVQLAVLQYDRPDGSQVRFYTEPMLVDDFLAWVEKRYGFVVGTPVTPHARSPVTLDEHRAYRDNVRALKDRLREIGFYDDLSDAYNAQTVRPRYTLARREDGQ
jgi:hypothetical protein